MKSGELEAGAQIGQASDRRERRAGASLSASTTELAPGVDEARRELGLLGKNLNQDRPLARPVVEVDQDELLPGPEREPPAADRDRLPDAPTIDARWWACELLS